MAEQAIIVEADRLKDEGNKLLAQALYDRAIQKYTEAINLRPSAIYFSNRAQAYIKQESYGLAIADANKAIELDPRYVKAYYRRGSANFALGKHKLARTDFKAVLTICPNDQDGVKKLHLCEKMIKAEAFSLAIECNYEAVAPNFAYETIEVEASYTGPRIPDDGVITPAFVLEMMEWLKGQNKLHRRYTIQILGRISEVMENSPSLLSIQLPMQSSYHPESGEKDQQPHVTVCGDTHGQFYDLCNIFSVGGHPSPTNPFLFNGDYVDRGSFSVEVALTLFAWKLTHPNCIYLLRGNHETKNMNQLYGFDAEVKHKYDPTVMKMFAHIFNNLPLAAVIQNTVFVAHGGISTKNNGEVPLDEIRAIKRNREPPESGLMSELLWSGTPSPLSLSSLLIPCGDRSARWYGQDTLQARGGVFVRQ